MSKSVTSVAELGALANNLTNSYNELATESCRITLACPTPQVAFRRHLIAAHFLTVNAASLYFILRSDIYNAGRSMYLSTWH